MKKLAILFVLILFVFFTGIAFSGTEDLSGTWEGSTEVDGMEVELTLVLEKQGDEYTGTISDSAGFSQDTELENLKVEGNALSFSFMIETGEEIKVVVKVDGTTMSGHWEDESGEMGDVEMVKK